MQENDKPVLVYATFPSLTAAELAGKGLVEEGLAACVNLIPSMVSIYMWEGQLERADETVMLAKTRSALAGEVMSTIRSTHDYENPALLVLPILDGSAEYLAWLALATRRVS